MRSARNERARARIRLQLYAPISEDLDLPRLEEEAAKYIEQSAKLAPDHDQSVSFAWRATATDFFGYVARKKAKKYLR
jgi:hypothetical protein